MSISPSRAKARQLSVMQARAKVPRVRRLQETLGREAGIYMTHQNKNTPGSEPVDMGCHTPSQRDARLHQHPLFQAERAWQRRVRDGRGIVHRINVAESHDDQPLTQGGMCGSLLRSFRPECGWS